MTCARSVDVCPFRPPHSLTSAARCRVRLLPRPPQAGTGFPGYLGRFHPHRHRASPCSQSTVLIPPLSRCISANVRSGESRFTLLSPCTMHHSFDHFVEFGFDLGLEVSLHLVDIGK